MERIVPTSFGRLRVIEGGKQKEEEEEPLFPPYALLGITGLEDDYDPEDWMPTHKENHYSNKLNHAERSVHHQPNHAHHLSLIRGGKDK